jgi:uncharacterized cupredoxin-like copper-binding protein
MRTLTIRWIVGLAVLATVAIIPRASAHTTPHARAAATGIRVTAKEFTLKLSAASIARPGTVTFSVRNAGNMQHDFRINGRQTALIRPGRTSRLVVTFRKKGRYHYLCTVPGHAAAGMNGVFTVR